MTRICVHVVLLAGVYALVLVTADPVDLITGACVASVLLVSFRRFLRPGEDGGAGPREAVRRLVRFPGFAAVVIWETTRGTWDVALVVLGLRPLRRPGMVAIPFEGRTYSGAIVTGLTATISPGEVLVDVDEDAGAILIHVLDATDPDAVRDRHSRRYARWQRGVAP